MEQLGLSIANSVSAPGISTMDDDDDDDEDNIELLSSAEATIYRAITARCNYLQPDRPDILFAVKEVCRRMSKPSQKSWEMLKRIGRYLKERPRLIWRYDWQSSQEIRAAHSDANWAGCKTSRTSSSGGTIALGNHFLRHIRKLKQ